MADAYIVTDVTTAELATLVSTSALVEGCQYYNTQTGVRVLATSVNTYIYLESKPYKSLVGIFNQVTTTQQSGLLEVGKTYYIDILQGDDNFTNVGYVEAGVDFVATGTTPTKWTNVTIVICATDAIPEVAILENTIGNIVFTRAFRGVFSGTLSGAFGTIGKFWGMITPSMGASAVIDYVDENSFDIQTGDTSGAQMDDYAVNCPFEVRVYY